MLNICSVEKEKCTACGSCIANCPKHCIEMREDDYDNVYPVISSLNECIECGKCLKVCPAENETPKNTVKHAYAGWSSDNEVRKTSASGGMASSIYGYLQNKGYICYGVESLGESIRFTRAKTDEDASVKFRNSKYVYVQIGDVIGSIKKELKEKHGVCVIGLPCHIAAVKNSIDASLGEKLLLVDIICHGVSSPHYLEQHIRNKSKNKKVEQVLFRNPMYGTSKFHFTLADDKCVYYDMTPRQKDEYQLGYHNGITYRDNCYRCRYTTPERVGDIMIADYWGLGKTVAFNLDKENTNLVYECTEKGRALLNEMKESGVIELCERPIEESMSIQIQLRQPTAITHRRTKFLKVYKKTHDFDLAIRKSMFWDYHLIETRFYSKVTLVRRLVKKLLKVEL